MLDLHVYLNVGLNPSLKPIRPPYCILTLRGLRIDTAQPQYNEEDARKLEILEGKV
jgi:hypothetical protein